MISDHPAHIAEQPKFCKDCKHCKVHPALGHIAFVCARMPPQVNLVTGEPDHALTWCEFQRNHGPCGVRGRLFEPKDAA